jgi:hypothetical protein
MKDFKITINVNETNLILRALGNMPYNQVNELVAKIHSQVQEQLLQSNEEIAGKSRSSEVSFG